MRLKNALLQAHRQMILLGVIVLYTLIFSVFSGFAWSNNTFYNGSNYLTTENLTFVGIQNITRNLSIPQGTYVMKGYFNISYKSGGINLSQNLTAYWKFNEVSGDAIDNSSHFFNLTNSKVVYTTGKLNNGALFNGTASFRLNASGNQSLNISSNQFTIALWIKTSDYGLANVGRNYSTIVAYCDNGEVQACNTNVNQPIWMIRMGNITPHNFNYTYFSNGFSRELVKSTTKINDGNWHRIVVTRNATRNLSMYVDGVLESIGSSELNYTIIPITLSVGNQSVAGAGDVNTRDTGYFNGSLDDLRIYNGYAWGQANVTADYNLGIGKEIIQTEGSNFNISSGNTQIFAGVASNTTDFDTEVKSSSLVSYLNNYLTSCTFISGFCNVPFIFMSAGDMIIKYSGLEFDNFGLTENSQTYNATTTETSIERISINVTYDSSNYINAIGYLIYNGTTYSSSITSSGANAVFYRDLDIPIVSGVSAENKSFFWNIKLYNGTGIEEFNTSWKNQSVSRIFLEKCNATYTIPAFNFSAYTEQNLTKITPFVFSGTFNFWSSSGTGSVYRTTSLGNTTSNEISMCISPAFGSFKTTSQIDYGDNEVNYDTRSYYFDEQPYNNITQNISLLLLDKTTSVSFILLVQDSSLTPLPNTYIFIQRYYPSTNSYKTTQIAKTNDDGKSVGFFQTETADYRFILIRNGEVILTTNNQKVVPESVPYTLTFTIGEVAIPLYQQIGNLNSSLYYNRTTKNVVYSYIYTGSNFTKTRLLVDLIYANTSNHTTICNENNTISSGIITCDLSGLNGTALAKAYITTNNIEEFDKQISFDIITLKDTFGMLGIFIAMLLILFSSLAFIWSINAGLIAINGIIILINWMGLVAFGNIFIFGIIVVSIIIAILTRQ